MEFLNFMQESWELLVGIGTGVAGLVRFYFYWKAKQESAAMKMLEELEQLKKKMISQFTVEIKYAEENARSNRMLIALKSSCPECYEKVRKNLEEREKGK